jgi:hypothetical protein
MKRMFLLVLAIALSIPMATQVGCGGATAQEKAWEKDIPQVPPGDRAAGATAAKK